jgi:hypothetical protein
MYGVTIDDPWNPAPIVDALASMPQHMTARVVFDPQVRASQYVPLVRQIRSSATILGELVDSSAMKRMSVAQFQSRTNSYYSALDGLVDIWEICNECNGEWLGTTPDVVAKMTYAYDQAVARGYRTALTLYYNQDCWSRRSNEMFRWTLANVPDRMKQQLDYVFISYYEDDCNGLQPDWGPIYDKLGQMFPNSQIGFGEVGTQYADRKAAYVNRYYNTVLSHPRYVGGYFWWYFAEDMVPKTKGLWNTLANAIR